MIYLRVLYGDLAWGGGLFASLGMGATGSMQMKPKFL